MIRGTQVQEILIKIRSIYFGGENKKKCDGIAGESNWGR